MKKRIPLALAIAVVAFVTGGIRWVWLHDRRMVESHSHAITNYRFIDAAKEQWAMATGATNGTPVTQEDLSPYLKGGMHLENWCMEEGTITIGAIGAEPSCTVHGTNLLNPKKGKTILFFKEKGY